MTAVPLLRRPYPGSAAKTVPADHSSEAGSAAKPPGLRAIHLLYVPTLYCNLQCSYCYLGEQTSTAHLRGDAARAVQTLTTALQRFDDAGVLPFNVSLHGGEVTTLPPAVLEQLFQIITQHYQRHADAIQALGHRKSVPHIKTNLYRFASLLELFKRYRVSISASIDLPLRLHAEHRRTKTGADWLQRTHEHLRLLAAYPHGRKISATLSAEHLADPQALIDDIWFIHRELGFDMNAMNLMFAFASELNTHDQRARGKPVLTPATEAQQLALYDALHTAFAGTQLDEGLRRHWFDEFTPSYCTNAVNCGDKFYLLQSDGEVYSCVRGQGIAAFHYGNALTDPIDSILARGARQIAAIHQQFGLDSSCQSCGHLQRCNTGCAVVKYQRRQPKSYTCALQHRIYRDAPRSYPPAAPEQQHAYALAYARKMHPALVFADADVARDQATNTVVLPKDLYEPAHALRALINADPLLQALYSDDVLRLRIDYGQALDPGSETSETLALQSQLLKHGATWYTLTPDDRVTLQIRRDWLAAGADEPIRNTLMLLMLRDTPVVYGDEQRTKQEHLFTYQLYYQMLVHDAETSCETAEPEWLDYDLTPLLALHAPMFMHGVRNNLFVTTQALRDHHYLKQKNNAFYHIQAINLPFQNFEFFYINPKVSS